MGRARRYAGGMLPSVAGAVGEVGASDRAIGEDGVSREEGIK